MVSEIKNTVTMQGATKMAAAGLNVTATKINSIHGLPSKETVNGKCYAGLDKIIDKIDPSKTRHLKIADNVEVTYFCDKDGNVILEKQVGENGGVSFYYKGVDGAGNSYDVSLYDYDGDDKFDSLELKTDKTGYWLESTNDNGYFDKTSKIDIKS